MAQVRLEQRREVGSRSAHADDDPGLCRRLPPIGRCDPARERRDIVVRQVLIAKCGRKRHPAAQQPHPEPLPCQRSQVSSELVPRPIAGLRFGHQQVTGCVQAPRPLLPPARDRAVDHSATERLPAHQQPLGDLHGPPQSGKMSGDRGQVGERTAEVVVHGAGDGTGVQVQVDPRLRALPGGAQRRRRVQLIVQAPEQLLKREDRIQTPVVPVVERRFVASGGRRIGLQGEGRANAFHDGCDLPESVPGRAPQVTFREP